MPYFTTSDGLSLYYHEAGTGLPLLCLSGLTRNGRDFDFLAPHLSDLRLIRLDYRGRGQSDFSEDYHSYTVPREARDVVELLDHLGLERVAVLGTSRGGLVAMMLAAVAHERLRGVALNDIGPELAPAGLAVIMDYIGRRPKAKILAEAAAIRANTAPGFANVPQSRWLEEATRMYEERPDGLHLRYDPKLREALLAASHEPAPDLWPLFDALAGLPLCTLRGKNSDLFMSETLQEMQRRRPDMISATVPDRGHIPFLDEPVALNALRQWIGTMQ